MNFKKKKHVRTQSDNLKRTKKKNSNMAKKKSNLKGGSAFTEHNRQETIC